MGRLRIVPKLRGPRGFQPRTFKHRNSPYPREDSRTCKGLGYLRVNPRHWAKRPLRLPSLGQSCPQTSCIALTSHTCSAKKLALSAHSLVTKLPAASFSVSLLEVLRCLLPDLISRIDITRTTRDKETGRQWQYVVPSTIYWQLVLISLQQDQVTYHLENQHVGNKKTTEDWRSMLFTTSYSGSSSQSHSSGGQPYYFPRSVAQ